jgi:hypothetical protein
MQVENDLFPINTIDLQCAKVLVRPDQAESTKGKNVIISKEMPRSYEDKIWSREVVLEKAANGKNVLKITVKSSELGGGGGKPAIQSKIRALFSRTHKADLSDRSNYGEPTKDA